MPRISILEDEEYLQKIRALARKIYRLYHKSSASFNEEDLEQEGLVATIKSYNSFKPEVAVKSGMTFARWGLIYARYAMLNYVKKFQFRLSASDYSLKYDMETVKSANSGLVDISKYYDTLEDTNDHQEIFNKILAEDILETLDPADRELITDRFMNDMYLADIGKKHGLSLQGVHAKINRILDKIRCEYDD